MTEFENWEKLTIVKGHCAVIHNKINLNGITSYEDSRKIISTLERALEIAKSIKKIK